MASNRTETLGLSQWERSDKVLMEDFNADNAKLDAAFQAVGLRVDGLAGSKADVSALEGLAGTVSGLAGTLSGHTSALAGKGNCQLYTTTYTGDGQAGSSHPKTLTFPGRPLLVAVSKSGGMLLMAWNGNAINLGSNSFPTPVTWGANSVRWYCEQGAEMQYTALGNTYSVVALLALS